MRPAGQEQKQETGKKQASGKIDAIAIGQTRLVTLPGGKTDSQGNSSFTCVVCGFDKNAENGTVWVTQ